MGNPTKVGYARYWIISSAIYPDVRLFAGKKKENAYLNE